jgi:uncharacterized protein (TIGR01244 family)
MRTTKLDDLITVGSQPSIMQIRELSRRGFRSIVNLRRDGERGESMKPADEGRTALEAGLEYGHVPISLEELSRETVERFRNEMDRLPAPVYVHCAEGTRARAMAMVHVAIEADRTWEEVLEIAASLGLAPECEETREHIRRYMEAHWALELERMRNFRWVCH